MDRTVHNAPKPPDSCTGLEARQAVIITRLNKENEVLKARERELFKLLDVAVCPCCDKSGAYYDSYGEVYQCQWCHEVHCLKESKR